MLVFLFIFYRREVIKIRTLKFIVNGQIIEKDPKCDFSGLVPGTEQYLKVEFSFSPEWTGYDKVVQFKRFKTEFTPQILVDGKSCLIPADALKQKMFNIKILGRKGNVKLKTNSILIVQDGGNK